MNEAVVALDIALAAAELDGIVETVPSYRSLLVCYEPSEISFRRLVTELKRLLSRGDWTRHNVSAAWTVPVVYDPPYAQDLPEVAQRLAPEALLFGYWPTAKEVHALLLRYDQHHRDGLAVLDKIARAKPSAFRPGPARASTEIYDPGPAPEWTTNRDPHPSMPKYIPPGDDVDGWQPASETLAQLARHRCQQRALILG